MTRRLAYVVLLLATVAIVPLHPRECLVAHGCRPLLPPYHHHARVA